MSDAKFAKSISIEKLHSAVLVAAKNHADIVREAEPIPTWLRDPGILGLILRDVDFGALDLMKANALSKQIADGIAIGKPVTAIVDDTLILGVIPFDRISIGR